MATCSRNDVVLIRYPFSDFSSGKVRPAVVVSPPHHPSEDLLIVPLTSMTEDLLPGEFAMKHWRAAGLNVPTAVKRGIYAVAGRLVVKRIGGLDAEDATRLTKSLKLWLGLV